MAMIDNCASTSKPIGYHFASDHQYPAEKVNLVNENVVNFMNLIKHQVMAMTYVVLKT